MTDYDIWKTSEPDDEKRPEKEVPDDWEEEERCDLTEYEKRINRYY